jgi:hypothetical protein
MMGAKNMDQTRENFKILDQGPMGEEELSRMIRIGDYVYG